MTLIKNILSFVFLISVASAMEQVIPEIFGDFKGLHAPFRDKNGDSNPYAHFSPLNGVNNQIVKNLRLHGNYSPENKGFPRPNWDGKDPHNYPQDATASLLEILFPSYIGFLVDSRPSNPIHKWLKPESIARIFNAVQNPDFYNNPTAAVVLLAKALQPDPFEKIEKEEKKRALHNKKKQGMGNVPKYGPYSKLQCLTISKNTPSLDLSFSEILFNALEETANDKSTEKGYPQHIVERILLTYMWEMKEKKADLKPFYDTLSGGIINKSCVNLIPWSGAESCYNEDEYLHVKKHSHDNDPEITTLLKLGYPYFEDKFPPAIFYGVSDVDVDGKTMSYSDCGETSLRNFFMMVLYDFETKKFDWTRLESFKAMGLKIKENLIEYFRNICPSPIHADTPKARNAWAKVLFDLNEEDDEDKIDYLYPKPENGKYAIAPGLDNMLKVIGKLLGDPKWNKKESVFSPMTRKLMRLCKLFKSSDSFPWYWEEQSQLSQRQRGNIDPKDVSLLFKLEGKIIFEWIFEKEHFDFNRLENSKNVPCSDYNHESTIPKEISEITFPSYFYGSNLDSIMGKCIALQRIRCYQHQFGKNPFNCLKSRWIEQTGRHFANWKDYHTNNNVVYYNSIEDVLKMNILELTAHLLWNCVNYNGLPSIPSPSIRRIFAADRELYIKEKNPFHNFEFKKMARTLTLTLEKGSKRDIDALIENGVEEYLMNINSIPLLHLATYAGFEMACYIINSIASNNPDLLNEPTQEGHTPFHFAAQAISRERNALYALVNLTNANVNPKDIEGNTPLHLAARSEAPTDFLKILIHSGADVNCLNMNDQSPLDFAFDALEKKESFYEGNIEYLIECGANIHKEYRQGKTYLDWAISNNLSPHLIYILKGKIQETYIPAMILDGISYPEKRQKQCFVKSEIYYGRY